jgi:hypothetical protein
MELAADKPAYGDPCNGCGLCCLTGPCEVAREYLHVPGGQPCPALEYDFGRYWCGMLTRPLLHLARATAPDLLEDPPPDVNYTMPVLSEGIRQVLYVGAGCLVPDLV